MTKYRERHGVASYLSSVENGEKIKPYPNPLSKTDIQQYNSPVFDRLDLKRIIYHTDLPGFLVVTSGFLVSSGAS
jgi:hypothetical protein